MPHRPVRPAPHSIQVTRPDDFKMDGGLEVHEIDTTFTACIEIIIADIATLGTFHYPVFLSRRARASVHVPMDMDQHRIVPQQFR